ncbi:MAG: hypothetical protein IT486_12090 [Gammaproteobacteria bacterium]|nr:hypothetical protein [Gammaproteobacteria bacterium]
MKSVSGRLPERVAELLAGAAAGDLSPAECAELAGAPQARGQDQEFMRVAAIAQLAFLTADGKRATPIDAELETRLRQQALNWAGGHSR